MGMKNEQANTVQNRVFLQSILLEVQKGSQPDNKALKMSVIMLVKFTWKKRFLQH